MSKPYVLDCMLRHVEHVALPDEVVGHSPQDKPELILKVEALVLGLHWNPNVLQVLLAVAEHLRPSLLEGKHASVASIVLDSLILIVFPGVLMEHEGKLDLSGVRAMQVRYHAFQEVPGSVGNESASFRVIDIG